MLLKDQVALVTGAGRGIGRATALALAEAGATVICSDIDIKAAQDAADAIAGFQRRALALQADVGNVADIQRMTEDTIAEFGRIDILVSNAGVTRRADIMDITEADWDRIHRVNAKGVFFCLQTVARTMIPHRSGRIINIASIAGKGYAGASNAAYAASKGAVISLTKTAAQQLGRHNINVNAICPGVTRTALSDANGTAPKENYLCHTFLSDQRMDQHEDKEVKGIYSDAFTPEVRMPAGYGIPILAGENLHWMPMFNNRGDAAVRVSMRIRLTVIRERDRKTAIKPLYASLRSVQVPHLFFVEPGGDRRESTFRLPFNGRIHFMGTHIHPYGVSVELKNLSRNERVWIGTRKAGPESAMDTYASSEGYRFRAGESFRLTSIYDNPLKGRIDAMAGLFLLYSRD